MFQSNRGYDPTLCVLEECGYMNSSAVASALTYATNTGVTILMLCSAVSQSHWLSQLHKITEGDQPGVCLIQLKFLCDQCASSGIKGICVHGQLKVPCHIDAGGELAEDPVRQLMGFVSPNSYQTEICGSNFHTKEEEAEVFSNRAISTLFLENAIDLSQVDQGSVDEIFVCLDPVQAASSGSGIGLAIVAKIKEMYLVSVYLSIDILNCFVAIIPLTVLP